MTVEAYPYGAGAAAIGSAFLRGDKRGRHGIRKEDVTLDGKALTAEEFDRLQREAPGSRVIVPFLGPDTDPKDRAILDASILFPGGAIASDAVPWQIDGRATLPHAEIWPLPENAFAHPRSAGTFSRFLRVYVRERQEISLRDALAKTSLIPARILESSVPQMRRKGRIANGMDADLVVFDLATIADRHVREACTHLHRYAPCHRRRRASDRERHPGLEQPARPTRATNARALNAGRTSPWLGAASRTRRHTSLEHGRAGRRTPRCSGLVSGSSLRGAGPADG